MAYTLRTDGLAAKLAACIMVDEDGVTLREWVSGWSSVWDESSAWTDNDAASMTVDDPVVVGSASWKGTTRYYFETFTAGNFNFSGVRFPNDISFSGTDPASGMFVACAGLSGSHFGYIVNQDGGINGGLRTTGAEALEWNAANAAGPETADGVIPVDGTPISVGGNYQGSAGTANSTLVYGLESGSLSELVNEKSSAGNISGVRAIGGRDGQSTRRPGKYHVVALFDEHLTETEYQALHTDWFAELFETGGSGDTTAPTFTSGPAAANVGETSLDINATLDEAGTIYSVVLADGATAPTSAEVKAGTGSGGASPVDAGSTTASASTQATISHSGLTADTAYDVYVVAEDDESTPNLQASPTLVEATTTATATTKTVTVQIVGAESLTGLRWAFFDSADVHQWSAPTAKGDAASTDASGNLTVDVDGSALTDGQWGYLYVTDNDGTLSSSSHHGAPAQVTVS